MNWEAISAIGQIVGAIAVVVSLLYLAREIRTNASAARPASVSAFNRWLGQLAQNPHLAELWNRGIQDFESLEAGDRQRFIAAILSSFKSLRRCIITIWRGIWTHACGMRSKRACAIRSTGGLEFGLGGVASRIGSVRSLQITSISWNRQPTRPGGFAKK